MVNPGVISSGGQGILKLQAIGMTELRGAESGGLAKQNLDFTNVLESKKSAERVSS